MSYSSKQIDLLREAILNIYQGRERISGRKEVSYSDLGVEIERSYIRFLESPWLKVPQTITLHEQMYMSASPNGNRLDKLRKFATGNQKSMDEIHLFSLLIYLTDTNTKESSFSLEAFNTEDDSLVLPSFLAQFLSPIGSSSSHYHKLTGDYTGERTKNGTHSIYALNLEATENPFVLKCMLQETKNRKTEIYSGWSIFTEHDSLVFLLTKKNDIKPRVLVSNSCMSEFYGEGEDFPHAFICSDFEDMEEIDSFLETLFQINNWLLENPNLSKDTMIRFMKL